MEYNEEYFLEKGKIIDSITKDVEDKKYIKLCFIDLIDDGSAFHVDQYGTFIHINKGLVPKDYLERSAYHTKLAYIYEQIAECIDKVKIRFEPFEVEVDSSSNRTQLIVRVDVSKGRREAEQRKKEAEERSRYQSRNGRRPYSY